MDHTLRYRKLTTEIAKAEYLQRLEEQSSYGQKLVDRVPATGYAAAFANALKYWSAAPVIRVDCKLFGVFGDVPVTLSLASLSRLPNLDVSFVFPFSINSVSFADMFSLSLWGKTPLTLSPLDYLSPPMYSPLNGGDAYQVLYGAVVDFSPTTGTPVPYLSTAALQLWLNCRGVATLQRYRPKSYQQQKINK